AAGHEAWHERLPAALVRRVRRKTELGLWLLERRSWDVFAFYFGESDTASHHLWSLHDPGSPRRPSHVNARQRDGLARVYEALDEAVAELARAAGPDTEVTVVSDHGSGGSSDKVLYLNCVLEQAGLLRMHRSATAGLARGLKETALTQLPPRLRERVYRFAGARLPGLLESSSRFGAIDMARTTVFSDELNYFPALHFNLRGREPNGTLHPGDAPRVRRDVEQLLAGLRDPWTGRPVVAWVKSREQLYRGPYLSRAPDLLLGFELDGGYSYNMMPSAGAPAGTGPFRRLAPSEYLGRKGRSLPGSHRPHGLLIMAGPQVQARGQLDAEMADATASVLARLGIAPLEQGSGRVLPFGSPERAATHRRLPGAPVQRSARQGDEARVEARLRALGYLE
ncbi:MAG: alkaline phosphatase family protein, partial [Proteobacteria bacterium]|nr:alkaline phosphatase family protein [Pseudomonadota bacterium]